MLSDNKTINQPNESQANTQESMRLFNMDSPHFIKEEGKERRMIYQLGAGHILCASTYDTLQVEWDW